MKHSFECLILGCKGISILTLSLPRVSLIDFTLSNARRFYSSMGNPTGVKGLRDIWDQSWRNFMLIKITYPNFLHGSDLFCFGL